MLLITEVQDLGHATRPRSSTTNTRTRIVDEWDKLDQRIIHKIVGEWRAAKETSSLCGWLVAEGGQLEHKT